MCQKKTHQKTDKPNATVQQSLLVSPSPGSIVATGSFFCLGSQTLTVPEINIDTHEWRLLSNTPAQTKAVSYEDQFLMVIIVI